MRGRRQVDLSNEVSSFLGVVSGGWLSNLICLVSGVICLNSG